MPEPVEIITSPSGEEIRKFSNAKIRAYVDDVLKNLPPDRKIAAVAHVTTEKRFEISIAYKIDDNWSIVASGIKEAKKKPFGQAAVTWSK